MGRIRIKTANEIHNIVVMAFQQACDELGINNTEPVQFNDCKFEFKYTTEITTYDYLDEYLRDRYYPKAGDFCDIDKMSTKALRDVFVRNRYKISDELFEFDNNNELTLHINILLDRIGLMYAYSNTEASDMNDYIYLRIKESFGYLLQFFEFLKKFDHIEPAVDAFFHWNSEQANKSQEHLKTVYDGMSYIEYFKVVRQTNLEMQPIYDLAKVDVNELTYLQLRFRDGLHFTRSELNKFLEGENQNED